MSNQAMDTIINKCYKYQEPFSVAKNGDACSISDSGNIHVPAVLPENLGASSFKQTHNTKYTYIAGAMANGIGSAEIVIAMGKAGMLGFFGAGGLHPEKVEKAIATIQSQIDGHPYGFNLLHNPFEPSIEEKTVEMYLQKKIHAVSASAYLRITPYLVHYRVKGLKTNPQGEIVPQNHVFAKISRSELARAFMSPAPKKILDQLVQQGKITSQEAELAQHIPLAEDITAEADSGGHTDRRPFVTLLPTICSIRNEFMEKYQYKRPIRVGGAGGIATPQSVVAAYAMGADYVLTGSINQGCLEADTSQFAREMLVKVEPHDVRMAPAADMFEMGVELQVLKLGTMFPMRAQKLYELYKNYKNMDEIPANEKQKIEKTIFRKSLEQVWDETVAFFQKRDPSQLVKASKDPRHKMALVFRWYLGKSSIWAKTGDASRKMDYQIWCGQGMGSFNEWTHGSFLEKVENRRVVPVAHSLLRGAAIIMRLNMLAFQGVAVPPKAYNVSPTEETL